MKKGDIFDLTFDVSQKVHLGFIDLFKDKNILHMDDAYAQTKGFREKVMHGNILNGFLSYFVGECLPEDNVIIQTQEIAFYKPVYAGDSLRFHAEVADLFESVKTAELKFNFQKEDGVRVAKGKIQIGFL